MTLADVERMECDFLTVPQVAKVLKCAPQLIRDQAEANPKYLGFNIAKIGKAYKIPRLAFIAWVKGQIPVMVWKAGGDVNCL